MRGRGAGGPGSAGAGRIYIWNGGSLLIGQSRQPTDVHAHHAVQIALTPGPAIRFRSDTGGWREYRGVAITPDYPHAFDGLNETVAHVFVEPESREGRAIMERLGESGIVAIEPRDDSAVIRDLFAAWASTRDDGTMIAAGQTVITHLAGGVEPATPVDDRVARALTYIKGHIGRAITLEEVAAAVNLSPSRFRHLFVAETGMALRPYILWLRFQKAWTLISEGQNLTAAAHGAGFADSAHLSRTSRRMFGIPPVALQVEK
ncbi:MAG TPA: AraC family transcriptional regulator [Gemmatimonadaceae bacterium]|nr:AraC family transcriptional regulator [Gemmatimonadaceae bacterium]